MRTSQTLIVIEPRQRIIDRIPRMIEEMPRSNLLEQARLAHHLQRLRLRPGNDDDTSHSLRMFNQARLLDHIGDTLVGQFKVAVIPFARRVIQSRLALQ